MAPTNDYFVQRILMAEIEDEEADSLRWGTIWTWTIGLHGFVSPFARLPQIRQPGDEESHFHLLKVFSEE
jgi:hypothetical protein